MITYRETDQSILTLANRRRMAPHPTKIEFVSKIWFFCVQIKQKKITNIRKLWNISINHFKGFTMFLIGILFMRNRMESSFSSRKISFSVYNLSTNEVFFRLKTIISGIFIELIFVNFEKRVIYKRLSSKICFWILRHLFICVMRFNKNYGNCQTFITPSY